MNDVNNFNSAGLGAFFAGLGFFFIVIMLFFLLLYFIPTIIAILRHSHLIVPVILIDVLLGWTVIGWVVALVMSLIDEGQGTVVFAGAAAAPAATGGGMQYSPDRRYWWDGREWVDTQVRIPPLAQVSPDGKFWWDGLSWRNVPGAQPSAPPPPEVAPPA